jgi:hypothetical protein
MNYLFDNNLIILGIITGATIIIGYSIYTTIWSQSENNNNFNNVNTDIVTSIDDIETTSFDEIYSEIMSFDEIYSEILSENIPESISTVTTELTIHESIIEELCQFYSEELYNNVLDINDLTEIVNAFSNTELTSGSVNEIIRSMIETLIFHDIFNPF